MSNYCPGVFCVGIVVQLLILPASALFFVTNAANNFLITHGDASTLLPFLIFW